VWWHVGLLALLCLLTYFPGLDAHGVTNWQEGQRLIVARDMQARGQWLVPTVHGQPYIAKPPMIYWAQIVLANAMGQTVELWHLRFVVALAGLLGVLATYGAAREVLTPDRASAAERAFAARAALWSGSLLATGILYVRAARIGELDIVIVPFVTIAVWAVARAFRTHRLERRTNWSAVLVGVLAATGAMLTKDTALLFVAFAGYGGIAVWCAYTQEPLDYALTREQLARPLVPPPVTPAWRQFAGGLVLGAGSCTAVALNVRSASDLGGPILVGIAGAWLGVTLARLATPRRAMALFVAMSRTHPVLVLGVPAGVAIGWRWLVAQRIGPEVVASLAKGEADDNIRPFMPEAPINNFETMLFGLGIASVLAAAACVVLMRWRPRLTPGGAIIAAWIILSLIVFSVLGKGVQRYLTPLWPAWAMLAGWFVATWCRPRPLRTSPSPWLASALAALPLGHAVQYGWLRDRLNAKRSPRDLIAAILRTSEGRVPGRLFSFEYASPAFDYYAGCPVQIVGDPRALATMYAGAAWPLERFRDRVAEAGRVVLICRAGPIPGVDLPSAVERLRQSGFSLEEIGDLPSFEIDNGRTPMMAVIVTVTPPVRTR